MALTILLGICAELGLIETKGKRGRRTEVPVRGDLTDGRSVPQTGRGAVAPQSQGTRDPFCKLKGTAQRYLELKGENLSRAIAADRKTFAALTAIAIYTLALATMGLVGIVLLVRCALTAVKGRPVLVQSPGIEPRWGLWECVVAPSFALVAMMVVWTVLAVMRVKVAENDPFTSLLAPVLVGAYACYIVRRWYGQPLSALGIHGWGFWHNVGRGAAGFSMTVPLMYASAWLNGEAYRWLVGPVPEHSITRKLMTPSSSSAVVVIILSAVCLGPLIEELLLRGMLCGALRRRLGSRWTIVVSAEIFAVMHFDLSSLLPHFVIGLTLAYLYEKTRSLVASSVVHIMQNASVCGFLMLVGLLD